MIYSVMTSLGGYYTCHSLTNLFLHLTVFMYCWYSHIILYSLAWEIPRIIATSEMRVPYLSDSNNHSSIKWYYILYALHDFHSFTTFLPFASYIYHVLVDFYKWRRMKPSSVLLGLITWHFSLFHIYYFILFLT